ncbi:MAG: hypothetical protein RBS87_05225 [Acholeplasma sp.]|jgi:hypothetical protein|nr:hypothetical protein [Acholeplasma sp.]
MRKATKLFLMFLVAGLVFGIAGCQPKTPKEEEIVDFSALGGWTDGGDGVYTINTNTAAELNVSYNKGTFPNAFMQSAEITKDLSVYKKLVITVEGMGSMLLRLETKDDTPAKEVGLNVTAIVGTYEWNLIQSSEFLKKVDRIVIIGSPEREASTGVLKITALTFSDEIADGFIINDGFNNIQSNINEYNGTDEVFHFNQKYESNDEGIYVITYAGTDAQVAYSKPSGFEWAFMKTRVQGNFTNFNYAVFVVQGTAGHKLLIKPNEYNAVESFIWLDGTEQELVIDLTKLSLTEKNAITDFKIFIAAGSAGTSSQPIQGQVVFKDAFMIDEYEFEEPVFIVNEYNGTDATFSLGNWYDGGDLVYTITPNGSAFEVDYVKKGEWNFMYALVDGDFSGFAKLEFELTGQENKTILLKLESPVGNKEQQFTFDGTKQVFSIDLTAMTQAQLEQLNKVVMFAGPGGLGSGEFTIHSVTFKNSDYQVTTPWTSLDAGVYTFTGTGPVVVNYTKVAGQDWSAMLNNFNAAEVAGLNKMTIVVKGTAGKSVLIKPNDLGALEQVVNFTDANPVTVEVEAPSFSKLVIFGEGGTAPATGSFEIVSITLSYVAPEFDFTKVVHFNGDWVANNASIYTFDFQASKTMVTYNKLGGNEWEWFRTVFDAKEVAGLNTLTITLKGEAGKQVLIKPNDQGSLEKWVTFTDDQPITTVIMAEQFMNVFIFAEGGTAPASGSFEILSATLSYQAKLEGTWVENDPGTYAITTANGITTVNYTKVSQGWVFMKSTIEAAKLVGLNTVSVTLRGTDGKQVLVKVNDSVEKWVTFVGNEPVTVEITIPTGITGVIMFAEGGVDNATGSFEILDAKVFYRADLVGTWVENDANTYATTVANGVTTVNYTKVNQGWVFLKTNIAAGDIEGLNTLTITLSGTAGKQVLVKVNNSVEQWVTFADENPVVVTITIPSGINAVILFAEGGVDNATGTFVIHSAYIYHKA